MYWNINEILPYQRNFNLIDSERSIGKTYTTEKFLIKKCMENSLQFVYIVRTKTEKDKGALQKGLAKVLANEYPSIGFEPTVDTLSVKGSKQPIALCLALSEYSKIKKDSFPLVKYIMFDEYILDVNDRRSYFNGWDEPDIFLNIYHTIDREEDRVICFLLGNTISFYNPYHMHPAFNIPKVEKGQIWTSENVLFQWAVADEELKRKKSTCKFLRMIQNTEYGEYAYNGDYNGDNENFIEGLNKNCKYMFTFTYGENFGIYKDYTTNIVYISSKYDPYCKIRYTINPNDHTETSRLINKNIPHIKYVSRMYRIGNVRFENMKVKLMFEPVIIKML